MINKEKLLKYVPYFEKSFNNCINDFNDCNNNISIFHEIFDCIKNPTLTDIKWWLFWMTIFWIHEEHKWLRIESFRKSFINVFTNWEKFIYDIDILKQNIAWLFKPTKFASHVSLIWVWILNDNSNFWNNVIKIAEDILTNDKLNEIFLTNDKLNFNESYFKFINNKKNIINKFAWTFIFDYLRNLYFEKGIIIWSVWDFSNYILKASKSVRIWCISSSDDYKILKNDYADIRIKDIMIDIEKNIYSRNYLDNKDLIIFSIEDSLCWFWKDIRLTLLNMWNNKCVPTLIYTNLINKGILLFSDTKTPFLEK